MTKTTKVLLGVLTLVLLIAGGLFCFSYFKQLEKKTATSSEPVLIEKDKIVVGGNAEYVSGVYPSEMAPTISEIGFYSNVYQPLASFDGDRRLLPGSGLASNWSNPVTTIWRFEIDPKAVFSDGTPVLASDVKFSYDTVVKNNYPIAALLPLIKEVKVVADHTVDFITETPNPTFVNKLTYLFIVSEQDVTKNGVSNPIGSGPYKLISADSAKGELRHLVANGNYWKDVPKVKEVIEKNIVPKEGETLDQAYVKALLSKDVDIAPVNGKDNIKLLNADNNLVLKSWQDTAVAFFSINSIIDSPLKNLEVRKAITLAFDPKEVVTESEVQVVDQIVPSAIFGYNPNIKKQPVDIVKAKSMLAAAGYPDGFKLKFMSYEGQTAAQLDSVKAQFAKIGITLEIDEAKTADFMTRLISNDYIITFSSFSADSGDASEVLEQLFHTRGTAFGTANVGYSNKTVDALIEKTASTMDMKQRQIDMKQTIKLITDDVAYIPLHTSILTYGADKDIYWKPRAGGDIKFCEMAGIVQ